MMSVTVLFLGPARQHVPAESQRFAWPEGLTVGEARRHLAEAFPALKEPIRHMRVAVNHEFVEPDRPLRDGDELALIPPVSGGVGTPGILVELVSQVIPVDRVRRFVMGDPSLGGITTFEGVTRSETDPVHGRLVRLDYEAYMPMAQNKLEQLAADAATRWEAGRVVVIHRIGSVPVGEMSVMIAVACPHRAESFDAARWLIDTLKKDVPIWKRDVYDDGFARWVDPSGTRSSELS